MRELYSTDEHVISLQYASSCRPKNSKYQGCSCIGAVNVDVAANVRDPNRGRHRVVVAEARLNRGMLSKTEIEQFSAQIHGCAIRKVAGLASSHTENAIAWIERGLHEDVADETRAAKLHVDIAGLENLSRPMGGQFLGSVDIMAACVS
jgi:hypothetical protein